MIQFHCGLYFCNKHDLDKFMQPVLRHYSFVSFSKYAKPKVSGSFHECGELRTWTIDSGYLNSHIEPVIVLSCLRMSFVIRERIVRHYLAAAR